jgi:signal peptidase I
VKRCIGVAGDVVEVRDRQVYVNGEIFANPKNSKYSYIVISKEQISDKNLRRLGLDSDDNYYLGTNASDKAVYRMLLTQEQLSNIRSVTYIESATLDQSFSETPEDDIFPSSPYSRWNSNNYGPLTIPKKGMTIAVNDSTMGLYGETIRLDEHHKNVDTSNGRLIIDGKEYTQYTFGQDYYFMMGDNRNNSLDSRYWGFVPDDHIVGKALFVWLSVDQEADFFHKIRWSRLFSRIK